MIIVENLSKKYQHSNEKRVPMTLRETLYNLGGKFFQRSWKPTKANEFYALRSVEFKVEAGEVIGIIGRNGAGKSTLLKIMSRITFPDTGSVTLNGRVGSLLEIGAGFNQELTGRENVFLSGAILGMSHREIVDKYEEIVEFAGVGKFIDDPVKRYSSGMYLRLAFSVAAYLEPEILLLDEILGVGDMEFQDRCLAKIRDLSKFEGRTVLLISHNLNTIAELVPELYGLMPVGFKWTAKPVKLLQPTNNSPVKVLHFLTVKNYQPKLAMKMFGCEEPELLIETDKSLRELMFQKSFISKLNLMF